ncbi:hypothetical protein [Chitinophaga filiformis]|uniref:Uncharacterized protein n=1 Tax=Chitinophaga filiformis TaxID=104663 RepID=A0ABY4HZN2_CHIFI|nr:hypothetical protein [Chitinophaga filiformis]UPK69290.1 hypothetical protein MYF79_30485 [Chitinophaga filiformis]
MITGNDYTIISNKEFSEFFPAFIDALKAQDAHLIAEEVEVVEDEVYEYVLAKDKKAYQEYRENGYAVHERGEGCFVILAKRVHRLEYNVEITTKIEDDVEEAIDPYTSVLILRDTWSYTLVLPAVIEDSAYCQQVYDIAVNVLR